MIKVLILTYYFPPAGGSGVQRWLYFSKHFSKYGIEPFVITVDSKKASYRFTDTSLEKKVAHVKVFRTDSHEILAFYAALKGGDKSRNIPQGFAGEPEPGFLQKVARFIRGNFFLPDARRGWNRFAFEKAVELIRKENIQLVVTSGPPHSTHLVGLKLRKTLPVKWLADFRDPWTEVYYNRMLYKTPIARKKDASMEQKVLENADHVLTIGPGMKRLLQKKLPPESREKVSFIYNGYDDELFKDVHKVPSGYFCISHSGILSENQPIDAFLTGLKKFLEKFPSALEKIRLQFVGNVSPSILSKVEHIVGEQRLLQTGYVKHHEAIRHMVNADLLLNSFALSEDSSLLVSGKLVEYIATGNAILGLGDPAGDAAELLKGNPNANIFARDDVDGISLFIERIYLQWLNGHQSQVNPLAITKLSRDSTTGQLAEIIRKLL